MNPNWVLQFRDLPEIPKHKQWQEGKQSTSEQDIAIKVMSNSPITKDEETILQQSIDFYKQLIPLLKAMDFNTFSKEDFNNFKGYFNYAFNHLIMSENMVTCNAVTRIVRNECILKEKKSIPNVSFLTYPHIDIVKNLNRYNRANTPEFNVLYGADSLDSAILETKPLVGEMITVSIWENKNPGKKLRCYPISHGKKAREVNPDVQKGYQAFVDVKENENNHRYIVGLAELILDFLGEEFSKAVENHLDYFYSAIYSENIFSSNGDMIYDGIIYPSVQNKYEYQNLAIRPIFFDENFRIARIFEMVIQETFYDGVRPKDPYERSIYIKPLYVKHPNQLGADGTIIWP